MQKAQRPQIVDSENVIGMSVRVEHCIEAANVLSDSLLSEIRSGIDQNAAPAVLNQYRRPGSAVARIRRMTHGAIAADSWHAHGRPAAQHRERRPHFAAGTCCGPLAIALVTST